MHILHANQAHKMVILEKGQKLVASLTEFAKEHQLKGGLISGLGALKNVELGYYELESKEYLRKTFSDEDFELISLTGNISLKDDEPYIHVHACLGNSQFQAIGGHLFEAEVAVTAEIFISELGLMPRRLMDNCIGLALISGEDESS